MRYLANHARNSWRIEGGADPVRSSCLEGDDIEPAGGPATLAEALEQEQIGRAAQPQLLAVTDAPGRTPEARGAAPADFDEHQRGGVAHDQVQFADLVADVAGDMDQAGGLQQAPRRLFGIDAGAQAIREGRARRRGTPP